MLLRSCRIQLFRTYCTVFLTGYKIEIFHLVAQCFPRKMRRCCILWVEERAFFLTCYDSCFRHVLRSARGLLSLQEEKPCNQRFEGKWEASISARVWILRDPHLRFSSCSCGAWRIPWVENTKAIDVFLHRHQKHPRCIVALFHDRL